MSFLYKPIEEQKLSCEIKKINGKIEICFYSDCGKFGCNEMLQGYILSPERLMQILSEREDVTDEDL
jgi:hypothetical protein